MKRASARRTPKRRVVRRRSRQGGSFAFVGTPVVFVCPFCHGGETMVYAGEIRLDSGETDSAVLHPEPLCAEYMKNGPLEFLRLSREHYERNGNTCDHCGKRMLPDRPHSETIAEGRALWGELGEDPLTLCDRCFALEVKARSKGHA